MSEWFQAEWLQAVAALIAAIAMLLGVLFNRRRKRRETLREDEEPFV